MKRLLIDTHLYDINIILFEDDKIINMETISDKPHNSTYLMPSIKKVCDDNKLDEILIVNGPGSFTGVRLGVTVAKTMAYLLNIPIRTLSSLDLMAYSLDDGKNIFSLSDGNGYYIGCYNNYDHEDYFYLSNADYENYVLSNKIVTDVTISYEKIISFVDKMPIVNCHMVKPLYIKSISVENDKKN